MKSITALVASSLLVVSASAATWALAQDGGNSAGQSSKQTSTTPEDRAGGAVAKGADVGRNTWTSPDVVAPDSGVRRGVLPNGLRYAVVSNALPARSVSLRLHIQVGSFDERENERGVAHFLEHMAFNGTAHIPEGRVDTVFEAQGVAFGRDQNAYTGLFGTAYELDLPQVDDAKLDLAFQWLRDVADGVTLDTAAINRERGVIRAEDERTNGPDRVWSERAQKFLSPELRGPDRDPIGTPASIAAMDQATLRGFYERWYRPDQAILVVTGDLPADVLEQRIIKSFSSWTAKGPKPVREAPRKPDLRRRMDVLAIGDPKLTTSLNVCWTRPYDQSGPDTVQRTRARLVRRLWREVLNERLRGLAASDAPPFVGAAASARQAEKEALYTCIDALPVRDDWRRALEASVGEARRLEAHGVTQEEFDRALEGIRSEHRAAADGSATRQSSHVASAIMAAEIEGDVVASPHERFRILDRAAEGLKPRHVTEAFRRDFGGGGPLIVVTTPQAADAQVVRTAWSGANRGPAPAAIERATAAQWAYASFGAEGKVVERTEIATPGFTRLRFENGVVMNFKRLTTARDQVKVRVRFGAGRRELPNADYYAGELGAGLLVEGGLGRHDAETIRRLFNDHGWGVELNVGVDSFSLAGTSNDTDLDVELQIMSAFLTDPGFRRSLDAKLPTTVDLVTRQAEISPEFALSQALNRAVAPDGVYVVPPKEELLKIDSARFERLFRPALTSAPLEVTVVGDVTEERAIAAVARTLGALPPRAETNRVRGDTWFLRYPSTLPPIVRTTYAGGAGEKAIAALVWPLYVAEPKRRREEYALMILTGVMDDAIRHRVREDMGKSYAPQVAMTSPDEADQGSITAFIETTAADADAVAEAARETAREIALKGVTAEAFEAARKPVLDSGATRLEDINWWTGGLDGSARNPEVLRQFVDWEADFTSVTLEDVNRVAKVWLKQTPMVVIATPRTEGAATSAAASAGAAPGANR